MPPPVATTQMGADASEVKRGARRHAATGHEDRETQARNKAQHARPPLHRTPHDEHRRYGPRRQTYNALGWRRGQQEHSTPTTLADGPALLDPVKCATRPACLRGLCGYP